MPAAGPPPERRLLLQLYRAALQAADGRACVARRLRAAAGRHEAISAAAVGKAAAAMLAGASEALGPRLARALAITRHGYAAGLPQRAELIEAGHPVPDADSLQAGARLVDFLEQTPAAQGLVVLISGGASALVEVLPPGVALEDYRRANAWLLGSGLDIEAMNAVRKRLSCIKGGRLAARLGGRPVLNLLISDVPGDAPSVIGSGLLVPDPEGSPLPDGLPRWLRDLIERAPRPPEPKTVLNVRAEVLADNATALVGAAAAARAHGADVQIHAEPLEGDAAACGRCLAGWLRGAPPGVHLWGGETTVRLPAHPGRGGRNQHLALAAAEALAGEPGLWLLAGASDGSDGPTEDAGALVDGATVARGRAAGLDSGDCLRCADAGRFLEASGDLLQTGPTGTNVMDLVLAFRAP